MSCGSTNNNNIKIPTKELDSLTFADSLYLLCSLCFFGVTTTFNAKSYLTC